MISNISPSEHEKFCLLVEETIKLSQRIDKSIATKQGISFNEIKKNKEALEKLQRSYHQKIIELRKILNEYENIKRITRIKVRKSQNWFKYTYSLLVKKYNSQN